MSWLKLNRWEVLGLLCGIFAVYSPVIRFEFLNWDDTWYIINNELIQSWSFEGLYGIATEPVARNFAPLTIFTFLIEHTLWGMWSGGYHLTNLALHAINAILAYALLRRLTGSSLLAWTVSLIFALHPVQVETVAWVSSRKSLLSATFMLASFICWLRPDRTSRDEGFGTLWLILGLLSKASAVVVPPIVIAYDVLIARRSFAESFAKQVVPMFFSVLLILVTMSAQTTIVGGVRGHIGASKLWILAIDATILWRYVGMSLYPTNLCVLYDPATTGIAHWIALSVIGWVGVGVWTFRTRHSNPVPLFCFVTWLFLLFPVLNLFPITTLMNDRYLYLPLIPFFVGVFNVAGVCWMKIRSTESSSLARRIPTPAIAVTLGVMLCGLYTLRTLDYLNVWANPVTLWNHARQITPTLPVVQIQWAITLESEGRRDLAIQTLQRAMEQNPDSGDAERIQSKIDLWTETSQVTPES
ncbi:hypothetical protein AB1L42_18185 [Thalassoglobus sp. JC818]|uniref:hypothetical protein n=1 Tax=Thalassoglobus sp. JC818 TaxID=3232136 RepID=UPI00345A05F6